MVRRGDVFWARLPQGYGRRPVVILTRDAAIGVRTRVTVAPITRTRRGIRSEVPVGRGEGLPADSVVSADNILTVPKSLFGRRRTGVLGARKRAELDRAIRYALDIRS